MTPLLVLPLLLLFACVSGPATPDAGLTSPPNDAGRPDAGTPDAGTPDAGQPPIVAPADTWTWVDFPGAHCASGSATGLGVNPHAGATELAIYFEGGGSCHDATSCWGASPTATNLTGYDATTFAKAKQQSYPILNRKLASNPFAAMNLVYVPYCTGDLHAGTSTVSLPLADGGAQPTYFHGGSDVDVFLARLVPTFRNVNRVYLLGTSAGGFGTFLNFDRVTRAFGPGVGVDVVDDSGPAIVFKGGSNNQALFSTWGVAVPTGCAGCNSLAQMLSYDLQAQTAFTPPGRYAFLSFTEDTVIAPDFGYSLAEYPNVMSSFSASLPASPAAATLLVSNEASHVVGSDLTLAPIYLPWLSAMVGRDAGWADVTYAHP